MRVAIDGREIRVFGIESHSLANRLAAQVALSNKTTALTNNTTYDEQQQCFIIPTLLPCCQPTTALAST